MAIAVDNTSNGTDSGSTELTVAHTVTSVAGGGILVVTIQVTDSSEGDRVISSVTHNGEACTFWPGTIADDVIEERTEIWYRVNPTTGGTPNIVVTPVGSCTDLTLGAISLTGVAVSGIPAVVDSYDVSNKNTSHVLYPTTAFGQSFTAAVVSGDALGHIAFNISAVVGTPTGNIVAKLYSHTGTYGVDGEPDALLATSDNIATSSLSAGFGADTIVFFTFSGAQQVTLTNGTKYFAVIEWGEGTSSDYISIGSVGSSPTHSGNRASYDGSWDSSSSYDLVFYVYTASGASQTAKHPNTGPPTLSITTVGTSSYVIDSLAIAESVGTKITAVHTAGDSPIHKTDVGGDTHGSQFVDAGGAGPQTMNWNDTDSDKSWVLSAVAVQIAADDARVPRSGVVNFQIPGIV